VDLDLAFAGANFNPGAIGFTVEAIQPPGGNASAAAAEPERIGRDIVDLSQEQDAYERMIFEGVRVVRKNERFTHAHQQPISHLVIRPFRRGSSSSPSAEIRLGDIGLTVVESVGLAPRTITYRPTVADVEVHLATGQVVPPQVTDDGRLILPATASLIRVAIPASKLDTRTINAPLAVVPAGFPTSGRFAELLVGKWSAIGGAPLDGPLTLTDEPKAEAVPQPAAPSIPLDRPGTRTIDNVTAIKFDLAATVGDYYARTLAFDVEAIDGGNTAHVIGTKTSIPIEATGGQLKRVEIPSPQINLSTPTSMRALRLRIGDMGAPAQNRLRIARIHLFTASGSEQIIRPDFNNAVILPATSSAATAPFVDEATNEVLLPTTKGQAVFFFSDPLSTAQQNDPLTGRAIGCRATFDGLPNPFETAGGGCKDTRTGLIWSQSSPSTMTWHEAMWNSSLAGNVAPDADDDGRTSDNDGGFSTMNDTSPQNYCHELNEGGKTDWYMPTYDDLVAAFGPKLAGRSFGFDPRQLFHSSSSWDHNTALVRMLDDIQSARGMVTKATGKLRAVCVRRDREETHVCNPNVDANGNRFVTTTTGCTDTQSGFTWSRPARRALNWLDSATYCDNLVEGGAEDWRVPTKNDLVTLKSTTGLKVHATRPYWSSTAYAINTYALPITIPIGTGPATLKTNELQVMCVRR
jgi:hypothetical protein